MIEPPTQFRCPTCGSSAIELRAFAFRQVLEQAFRYEMEEEFDTYCVACGDYTGARREPITDLKTLAQIAIKNPGEA